MYQSICDNLALEEAGLHRQQETYAARMAATYPYVMYEAALQDLQADLSAALQGSLAAPDPAVTSAQIIALRAAQSRAPASEGSGALAMFPTPAITTQVYARLHVAPTTQPDTLFQPSLFADLADVARPVGMKAMPRRRTRVVAKVQPPLFLFPLP
jgi:hypothetical protein